MKTQTCLKPIYAKHEKGKMHKIIERYEFEFPEFITEDLGFEMHFGFPAPKDHPNHSDMKEYPRPKGLRTFHVSDVGYYTL